jgi:hypothetical protein
MHPTHGKESHSMNRMNVFLSPRTYQSALFVALATLLAGAGCRREYVTHARVAKGRSLVVSNAIFPAPNRVPRFPTGSVMAA